MDYKREQNNTFFLARVALFLFRKLVQRRYVSHIMVSRSQNSKLKHIYGSLVYGCQTQPRMSSRIMHLHLLSTTKHFLCSKPSFKGFRVSEATAISDHNMFNVNVFQKKKQKYTSVCGNVFKPLQATN